MNIYGYIFYVKKKSSWIKWILHETRVFLLKKLFSQGKKKDILKEAKYP